MISPIKLPYLSQDHLLDHCLGAAMTRRDCRVRILRLAGVMELADIRRLKRLGPWPCGFESRRPQSEGELIHINAPSGCGI
jgi:hypothetical protein